MTFGRWIVIGSAAVTTYAFYSGSGLYTAGVIFIAALSADLIGQAFTLAQAHVAARQAEAQANAHRQGIEARITAKVDELAKSFSEHDRAVRNFMANNARR